MSTRVRFYARVRKGTPQVVDRNLGCPIADCPFRESANLIARALNEYEAKGLTERPAKRASKSKTATPKEDPTP